MLNQQNRLMSYIPQYSIILKEISRVTCNLHFPIADVLLSVHQFSAFKSTLKVSVVGAISALGPFFFIIICSKLREKGWIVILRQVIPTSPLSLLLFALSIIVSPKKNSESHY